MIFYGHPGVNSTQSIWIAPTWRIICAKYLRKKLKIVRKTFRGFSSAFKESMHLTWVPNQFSSIIGSRSRCQKKKLLFQSPGLHLPSARERANSINRNISRWLSGVWGLNANVVALDYFCGSNLVDIAVNANLQKRSNSSQYLIIDINEWIQFKQFFGVFICFNYMVVEAICDVDW